MRRLVLLAAVLAAVVAPASADAFVWHLSYYKAKAWTVQSERRICNKDSECVAYGASCQRITESRVDCLGGTIDETEYGELQCTEMYHWGVNQWGRVKLRTGKSHCGYVE